MLFVIPLHNFCLLPYSSRVNAYCAGIPTFSFHNKNVGLVHWYTGTHRFLVGDAFTYYFYFVVNNEQRTNYCPIFKWSEKIFSIIPYFLRAPLTSRALSAENYDALKHAKTLILLTK